MDNITKTKSHALREVAVIRPIIIFLLVLMHSFTKFAMGGGIVEIIN